MKTVSNVDVPFHTQFNANSWRYDEVGMGQTTSWRVCSLNSNTSIAVYYEIVNQHSNPIPAGTPFYLQYCVRYKRSNGGIR